MSSLLSTTVGIGVSGAGEQVTFGAVTQNVSFNDSNAITSITNGTGSGQAQHAQYVVLTPATSGGTTYSLAALPGGLDGETRDYTAITWIKIENLDDTNSVTIEGGASNGWVGINGVTTGNPLTLNPGDVFCRFSPGTPLPVSGTNETILMVASGGTPNVGVSLLGLGT
jgi:hypothetical protein